MKSRIMVFILAKIVILTKVALSTKVRLEFVRIRLTRAFHGKMHGNIGQPP